MAEQQVAIMSPNTQTPDARCHGTATQLDRAKQLASTLLSERCGASGALVARALHAAMRALDTESRQDFQHYLATGFQPDKSALRAAAELYLADASGTAAAALARAADPPRQELSRRMNTAHGGTAVPIAMRGDIATRLRTEPESKLLDADLRHLFGSWFNRGFLELRRVDWQSPAAIREKLIAYEAVHEIKGWNDLRRRLAPDRRCFAFFHPALPCEPLIFVKVALVKGLATVVQPLLLLSADEDAARARAAGADTAIFYAISNCQDGPRGVSFGNFLTKQVVEELRSELPRLTRFSTLSPVPGFRRWLAQRDADRSNPDTTVLHMIASNGGWHDQTQMETEGAALMRLCAAYLTRWPSRGSTSPTGHGSSGSSGSAIPRPARSRNPSASWSTISTTMTPSRITTRPSRVTGRPCVRRTSTSCWRQTRRRAPTPRIQKFLFNPATMENEPC
jgi:malonyl-CoA decarboxylase